MDSEQTTLSFERVFGVLRRRWPWILLCLVLATAAAYGYSKHKTKLYTATSAIAFSNNPLSQEIAGLPVSNGDTSAAQQVASSLELVRLGDAATKTASLLGRGFTGEKIRADLSISAQGETNVIDVSATSASPVLAAAIANTYTRLFVKEQQIAEHQLFKSALALVNKQLARLSPVQRYGSDGLELQDRAHTLSLLTELNDGNVRIAGEALVPTSPSSPKTKTNTVLGAVLGLLLGIGIAFLLERFDRRIRGPEDLEAVYHLPLLGAVPKSAALAESPLPPTEAEAFSLIRAHLRFFNVDRDVRTIVIASPASGDGKSIIARHLAEAAARLGSRTLLLEVDLRHPTLAQQLGIQSGPGLADVLIGAVVMGDATQSVVLRVAPGEGTSGHTLDALVAGAILPLNPGELLESQAMGTVLERAKSAYDLIVIDTPPLTAVSDAFPLLTKVDGVVIVGRVGHSRQDAAERLQQVLASSGAPLLGVIANGSKSGASSPYPASGSSSAAASAKGDSSSEELVPN
jgi:succinoglycan biosynthesis transport protein ExoP